LTSALFAARYGLKTVVIEKLMVGGQITLTSVIENFPGFYEGISGISLAKNLEEHAKKYDVTFKNEEVLGVAEQNSKFIVNLKNSKVYSWSVIIAIGAQPRRLSISGEEKFTGTGVSYCATCDGPFYKGKDIIVIGGGNTAVEEALYLSEITNSVSLIHRRDRLRAVKIYQNRIDKKNNIEVLFHTIPVEISGDDKVTSLVAKNIKTDEKFKIKCDGIFIFAGYVPNSKLFRGFVEMDSKGYIITDSNMKTSHEGVFAAGDVRSKKLRQVVTACSDGAIASDSAYRYISKLKGITYADREDIK